jgi:hypothetical protein
VTRNLARCSWLGAVCALTLIPGQRIAGQAPSATGSTDTPRAAREALLAADRALSAAVRRDGLAAGLASVLGADGLVLFEGAPIVAGPQAATAVLGAPAELGRLRVEWLPLAGLTSPDRSLGLTYGVTLVADRTAGDSVGPRSSNYISVWRRRDGRWTLAAHVQTGVLSGPAPIPPAVAVPVPAPAQRTDGSGARFARADLAFARLAGDSGAATAFATFVAPTGVVFAAAGELLIGPDAVGRRMRENPNRSEWVWEPRYAGASDDGELGFTVGEATITVTRGDDTSTFHSKYLTVWRRMAGGSIRFLVDGGNARPAPGRPSS